MYLEEAIGRQYVNGNKLSLRYAANYTAMQPEAIHLYYGVWLVGFAYLASISSVFAENISSAPLV